MITNLPYGLIDGKLRLIHEVDSGLKCGCVCPSCGGALVARKGSERAHHFAHHHEGNCKGAIETALHLAAKEILAEHQKIMLPALEEYDSQYSKRIIILSEPFEAEMEEVRLEQKQDNFKPDVIGVIKGREIYIEIAVTHFVDEEKELRVRKKGVSMLEIDLSDLNDGFTKEELIEAVIYSHLNKNWIYNAKQEYLLERKLAPLREKYEAQKLKRKLQDEEEEKAEEEEEEKERKEQEEYGIWAAQIQFKKESAESRGFQVHWIGMHSCKYLMTSEAKKYPDNEFTTPLKNGAYWNGEIYGKGDNGRYVFIDGEGLYIFPPHNDIQLSVNENAYRRKIYGQLNSIKSDAVISASSCARCEHFQSFLDDEKSHVVCRFRKK